jgi:hypothetical protein
MRSAAISSGEQSPVIRFFQLLELDHEHTFATFLGLSSLPVARHNAGPEESLQQAHCHPRGVQR